MFGKRTRREPFQAGRFYPADPRELRQTAQQALARATRADLPRPVMGLVSPHAGYAFSGATAAWAYKQIEGGPHRRVVVLAPSHYVPLSGASIYWGTAYRTPLGEIPMDEAVVGALRARAPLFDSVPETHTQEHSLEVQLPFLQVALGEFSLVPILVNGTPDEAWRDVADALFDALNETRAQLGKDTLVVASSDLYHGPSEEACERADAELAGELERFDPENFARRVQRREIQACGAGPIAAMMRLVKRAGGETLKVLRRTNSSREYPTGGDYVVGYLAAAAY